MRSYDIVLIFRSNITTAAKDKILTGIKKWMGEGKIAKTNEWGKKAFTYPIKKEKEGMYVLLEVETEKGLPTDFEKKLIVEDAILRHLVLRND
jgi:small subunit ribosomal protein S6